VTISEFKTLSSRFLITKSDIMGDRGDPIGVLLVDFLIENEIYRREYKFNGRYKFVLDNLGMPFNMFPSLINTVDCQFNVWTIGTFVNNEITSNETIIVLLERAPQISKPFLT